MIPWGMLEEFDDFVFVIFWNWKGFSFLFLVDYRPWLIEGLNVWVEILQEGIDLVEAVLRRHLGDAWKWRTEQN